MAEENYQSKMKCPKCGKRKVYVTKVSGGYQYTCKACGYTWRA